MSSFQLKAFGFGTVLAAVAALSTPTYAMDACATGKTITEVPLPV